MQDFHKLVVWQKSHKLTMDIYRETKHWPKDELYGQTSQIRRAVSSIPTNIAEGCGRRTNAEFTNFLNIAAGSASEVEYELFLAKDLGYITDEQCESWTIEIKDIRGMLNNLMDKIRSSNSKN